MSNALRAALTARSMSAASPSATSAMTSSVAGLIVSNVLPLLLSRHLPSISSLVWMRSSNFASRSSRRCHESFSLAQNLAIRAGVDSVPQNPNAILLIDPGAGSSHTRVSRAETERDLVRAHGFPAAAEQLDTVLGQATMGHAGSLRLLACRSISRICIQEKEV